ncbi:hypothetical protein RJ641_002229 [Dillenia turbinata]|uniref:Pentatricopeptide repeat-containing protein n=1 Tax=Dillenia turbinata TaxID=194707 RepID=A0AAN8VE68_9MAGN
MLQHYACIIDILDREGKLDDVMELVNTMPFEANAAIRVHFWVLQESMKILNLADMRLRCFSLLTSRNLGSSSGIIVNSEYLAMTEILPFSTQSFAPVTNQYPGGPPGYTAEFRSTLAGCSGGVVRPALNLVLISIEMAPNFLDCEMGASHSDLRIFADATIENPSLKNKTFLIPTTLTSNQAFVTIEAESSMRAPFHETTTNSETSKVEKFSYLHRRYRFIAWLRNPLPRTPVRSVVIGTKDIDMALGDSEINIEKVSHSKSKVPMKVKFGEVKWANRMQRGLLCDASNHQMLKSMEQMNPVTNKLKVLKGIARCYASRLKKLTRQEQQSPNWRFLIKLLRHLKWKNKKNEENVSETRTVPSNYSETSRFYQQNALAFDKSQKDKKHQATR